MRSQIEIQAIIETIRYLSDIGNLFDGHDELTEITYKANAELMESTLDRIYKIITCDHEWGRNYNSDSTTFVHVCVKCDLEYIEISE